MTAVADQEITAIVARAEEFMRSGLIKATQCGPSPKRAGTGQNRGKGIAFEWLCKHVNHEGKKCLFWPFSKAYGHPSLVGYCGKVFKPTRLMCLLAHGAPPSDLHQASHTCGCGIKGCIHPQHLAWRTRSEFRQNLEQIGPINHGRRGKITPVQAEEIKAIGDSERQAVIAKRYGISAQRVGQILLGHGFSRPRKVWRERSGRFDSKLMFHGTSYWLGVFTTSEQATAAYHSALAKLHRGEPALPVKKEKVSFEDIRRWHRAPEEKCKFGDREGEAVISVAPIQEQSVFITHNALAALHPRVQKLILVAKETGDLTEARISAGLSETQVAMLLPRVRAYLGPLLQVGARRSFHTHDTL
jgi:hypothetical protein